MCSGIKFLRNKLPSSEMLGYLEYLQPKRVFLFKQCNFKEQHVINLQFINIQTANFHREEGPSVRNSHRCEKSRSGPGVCGRWHWGAAALSSGPSSAGLSEARAEGAAARRPRGRWEAQSSAWWHKRLSLWVYQRSDLTSPEQNLCIKSGLTVL